MIHITGDTHADFRFRFNSENFPEQKKMTKEDFLLICGDFGGVWEPKESKNEKWWLDWFETRPYTTLFIDGNHENHEQLATYPVKEWNGGRVHVIRPHVLHLMRGQVFTIQEKSFFTFGGAQSHDVRGGILEPDDPDFAGKLHEARRSGLPFRINHVSWWAQEMPSEEEMAEGLKNLAAHNNTVDFIVTHCCATSTQSKLDPFGLLYKPDAATEYLEQIHSSVNYGKWYFGHYHDNRIVTDKEILLYEQIIRVI